MASLCPVQFRGVSSLYKARDPIKLSYRYVAEGGFHATPQDWVGLVPESAATLEEVLASVPAEDPTKHSLCDGGLYRTGSATFKCPEIGDIQSRCVFWYVSSGQVMGRSDPFPLYSADTTDFLNVSLCSMGNHELMSASRCHSDSGSYVDVGGTAPSTLGSSFVLVSEEDSCGVPGSEDGVMQCESACLGGTEGKGEGERKEGGDTRGDSTTSMDDSRQEAAHNLSSSDLLRGCAACSSYPEGNYLAEVRVDKIKLKRVCSEIQDTDDDKIEPVGAAMAVRHPDERWLQSSSEPSIKNKTSEDTRIADSSLMGSAVVIDMTSSTVLDERHVSQREARMLRVSNKELRAKIQKLSDILQEKKVLIGDLTRVASESEEKMMEIKKKRDTSTRDLMESISSLKSKISRQDEREMEQKKHVDVLQKHLERSEAGRIKAETLNKKLLAKKVKLEGKAKQLLQENKTVFERSTKLLSQLQDSETKREIEKSEKKVLQGKIDYLAAELHRKKHGGSREEAARGEEWRSEQEQERIGRQPKLESTVHHHNGAGRANHRPSFQDISGRHTSESRHVSNVRQTPHKDATPLQRSQDRREGNGDLSNAGSSPNSANRPRAAVNGHPNQRGPAVRNHRATNDSESRIDLPMQGLYETLQEGASVGSGRHERGRRDDRLTLDTLSEGGVTMVECPICRKQLSSRQNDFAVLLHVEHCIQLSEVQPAS